METRIELSLFSVGLYANVNLLGKTLYYRINTEGMLPLERILI
jgi:hypothetical protein